MNPPCCIARGYDVDVAFGNPVLWTFTQNPNSYVCCQPTWYKDILLAMNCVWLIIWVGAPHHRVKYFFLISLFSLSSCSWLSFLKMAILNSSQMAQCQNRVWPPAAWTMPLRQLPTVQLHTICREQHCRAFGRALPVAESLADCQALHCRLKIALFAELSTNT